jgi:oligopeptide/dipeptide ABC transporter ATP-binding protein
MLQIRELTVTFSTPTGRAAAVDAIDCDVSRGQTVAVVGESGCGKTTTALAIMGLLQQRARVSASTLSFGDSDLLTLNPAQWRAMRRGRLAMIFQEPMTALNPVMRIGAQVAEPLHHFSNMDRRTARRQVLELLDSVGIPDPERCASAYAHELSGGMRQRALIAMALALDPDMIIADEPTTALDVALQGQILDLLRDLQRSRGMALLLITHNLPLVSRVADEVYVMYAGKIVERGSARRIVDCPAHPYSSALLQCVPTFGQAPGALTVIPGQVPDSTRWPTGCRFRPRCTHSLTAGMRRDIDCDHEGYPLECGRAKPLTGDAEHSVACHFPVDEEPYA